MRSPDGKVLEATGDDGVTVSGGSATLQRPDAVGEEDWATLSPACRARAVIWHELSETEKHFHVEDAVGVFLAWRRMEIARLDRMIEAGAMDPLDSQIDAHRKIAEVEPGVAAEAPAAQPPTGTVPTRPAMNGHGEQWPHRVYDFMAASTEWVTIREMMAHFEANHATIFGGLDILRRDGVVVEGPTALGERGRRVKQFALARK